MAEYQSGAPQSYCTNDLSMQSRFFASIVAIFVLSIVDFFLYSRLYRLLIRGFRTQRWVSNIPGSPYAADSLLIAAIGPYPELNDFNGVSMQLPLPKKRNPGKEKDSPNNLLVIRGFPPRHCRYWSLQLFLDSAEKNQKQAVLLDDDIQLDEDGRFTVYCGPSESDAKEIAALSRGSSGANFAFNHLNTGSASSATLCMRIFVCPAGVRAELPSVHTVDKCGKWNEIPHLNNSRISGPASTAWMSTTNPGPLSTNSPAFLPFLFNILLYLCMASFRYLPAVCGGFTAIGTTEENVFVHGIGIGTGLAIIIFAAGLAVIWRRLAFNFVAKRNMKMLVDQNGGRELIANQTIIIPDPAADTKNNPNHCYYTFAYDLTRDGCCLSIRGLLPHHKLFSYTSIHVYDQSSLPLPEYYYDETLIPDNEDETKASEQCPFELSSLLHAERDERECLLQQQPKTYTIHLINSPSELEKAYGEGRNAIDVRSMPKGICIVRIVKPRSEGVIRASVPRISIAL